MTDRKDLRPLAADDATDPRVRDALEAVRREASPSDAALARLHARLAAAFDEPPPPHGAGHALPTRRSPLRAVAWTAAAAALLWASWQLTHAGHGEPKSTLPASARALPAVAKSAAAPPSSAPVPGEQTPLVEPRFEPEGGAPAHMRATRRTRAKRVVQASAQAPSSAATQPAAQLLELPAPTTDVSESAPVNATPTPSLRAPVSSADGPAVPARPPPSREDEALLLSRARRLVRADPAAALALVDAHRTRFPTTALTPEREVIAIEALRALGRASAAAAREQAFRHRFPDSIYLRRLTAP